MANMNTIKDKQDFRIIWYYSELKKKIRLVRILDILGCILRESCRVA